MKIQDTVAAKGEVTPYFVNLRTGRKEAWPRRHNTLSYDASYAMAALFGGIHTEIPNRIGIIYGGEGINFPAIDRYQTWKQLEEDLSDKNADVQVQAFSFPPSIKAIAANAESEASGEGTAVIFHAHSDSGTPGAFGTYNKEAASESDKIFTSGTSIYQAVLLNYPTDATKDPKIIARVSLVDGDVAYTKPENFEIAIDWTVKFL